MRKILLLITLTIGAASAMEKGGTSFPYNAPFAYGSGCAEEYKKPIVLKKVVKSLSINQMIKDKDRTIDLNCVYLNSILLNSNSIQADIFIKLFNNHHLEKENVIALIYTAIAKKHEAIYQYLIKNTNLPKKHKRIIKKIAKSVF